MDERNLEIMNLTHFHPKSIENLGKNNSSVNIRFVVKTSDIRNFSQNIRADVKTSKVATLAVSSRNSFLHNQIITSGANLVQIMEVQRNTGCT